MIGKGGVLMMKMINLYEVLETVASYPDVHMTQIDNLKFKIVMRGELMKSFMRFGEIQEEIKKGINGDFEMKTIFGDNQDAIIEFKEV